MTSICKCWNGEDSKIYYEMKWQISEKQVQYDIPQNELFLGVKKCMGKVLKNTFQATLGECLWRGTWG